MISLHVRYGFPAGHAEEAAALLGKMQAASRTEPGCIAYSVHRLNDDPTSFWLHEEWVDQASLDAHMKTQHFLDFSVGGLQKIASRREVLRGRPL
ncbi:MAG: antibiotic biosynthesis monooxygenase [Candidatus Eremiobacteraeota bacterium]|nr:antibiotic biosynthesis monooxygenase [Candidatus Eremiobacteraeota bacterium]